MQYTVLPGDCLSSLASKFGLPSWRTIHDHPNQRRTAQQAAQSQRSHAGGDGVHPGGIEGQAGERRGRPAPPVPDRAPADLHHLRLRNIISGTLPPADYTLTVGSATTSGAVKAETVITLKIDPEETSGRLVVTPHDPKHAFARIDMTLNLGQLDPPDTVSGVQARLNNLGFHCGPAGGTLNADTTHAIRAFQLVHKMTVDGKNSPALQEALRAHHGS